MNAFFVPLRSTQKAFKNIVLYFDFIFYKKWVTSIYNADAIFYFFQKMLYFFEKDDIILYVAM